MKALQNLRHNDGCDLLRFAASQATCRKRQIPQTCPLDCLLSCQMRWLEQLHHSTLGQNEFFRNENRWRSVGCLGESTCWACFSLCNEPRSCSSSSWSSMFSGAVGQLAFSASAAVVAKGRNYLKLSSQTNSTWSQKKLSLVWDGGREMFPS